MSAALERVIAEQQHLIDRLKAQVDGHNRYSMEKHREDEDLVRAVIHFMSRAIAEVHTDEKDHESWRQSTSDMRLALSEFGYCFKCGCLGYCQCDDFE